MEPDYQGLDPDERYRHIMAIASVSLGIISLFAGILPICGAVLGLLGLGLGFFSRKSENRKLAMAGMAISTLGIMIAVTYQFLAFINNKP